MCEILKEIDYNLLQLVCSLQIMDILKLPDNVIVLAATKNWFSSVLIEHLAIKKCHYCSDILGGPVVKI